MAKKSFFEEPTVAEILKYTSVREASNNLVQIILSLGKEEALIIKRGLIPEKYSSPRKFMKHAETVKLKRYTHLKEAINAKTMPMQLRREAFDRIGTAYHSAYSFKPFMGVDQKTRKISLVECLEGAKLYNYITRLGEGAIEELINIKPYDDAKKVAYEGAEIVVQIPSRTEKESQHQFKFSSVPVVDSKYKWAIANSILTDHNCGSKRFNIRYRYFEEKESSRIFNFCAHEIAAYFAISDYYYNRKRNKIPHQMSQMAIPNQFTADYYGKLEKNCLIRASEEDKPRKLVMAEKEILLWALVERFKHEGTFLAKTKVRDYKW